MWWSRWFTMVYTSDAQEERIEKISNKDLHTITHFQQIPELTRAALRSAPGWGVCDACHRNRSTFPFQLPPTSSTGSLPATPGSNVTRGGVPQCFCDEKGGAGYDRVNRG